MTSLASLDGAVFNGHLAPPDGARCEVIYRFRGALQGQPSEVQKQRRSLGWSAKADVECAAASVSIPALGMDGEEVVASFDAAAAGQTRRLLVQSLSRPELGLTVLLLSADGSTLEGGDESWEPGATPLITAARRPATTTSRVYSPSSRVTSADSPKSPKSPGSSPAGTRPRQRLAGKQPAVTKTPSVSDPRPALLFGPEAVDSDRPDMLTSDAQVSDDVSKLSHDALDEKIKAKDAEACERLVSAAHAGETGDMRLLLARLGPDRGAPAGSLEGLTPLMAASARGRTEAIEVLLEKRASLEVKDPTGWTALMHAIHGQRPAVVRTLLDAKAAAHVIAEGDDRKTPLMLAVAGARTDICTMVLQAASQKEAKDSEGQKAIHHAAKRGNNGALAALINARAQLNDANEEGMTPLLLAAVGDRSESVRILIANRADVTITDPEGRTASKLARIFDHGRVLRALGESGG